MTARIRAHVRIRAPIESVFSVLDDHDMTAALLPLPSEIKQVERLPNGGKRIRYTIADKAGQDCEGVNEHVVYEPPHRAVIVSNVEGPTRIGTRSRVTAVGARTLQTVPEGTQVTLTSEYTVHTPVLGRLIEFQWRRPARRYLHSFLMRVKEQLEGEPAEAL